MFKNDISDLKIHDGLHHGIYRGVVEDINDPLSSGRVRARIQGLHTQTTTKNVKEGIPTNELPWAEPCIPVAEGGITKYGFFSIPRVNSHVAIYFENGNPLRPIYFGSLPGGNGDWDTRGGTYPDNTVLSVHGGHYMEFDSTSGSERIKIYHKSGSIIEMKENGDIETTVTNDAKDTVSNNKEETISGDKTNTITGDKTETMTKLTITASGVISITGTSITLTGPVTIAGGLAGTGGDGATMEGDIEVTSGDVTADSISLKNHVHGGVQAGGSTTGPPQ